MCGVDPRLTRRGFSYFEDLAYHSVCDVDTPALHLIRHLPARLGRMVGTLGVRRPGGFYTTTSGAKSASVASPTFR
jgi:hypothetical protein